MNAYEIYIAWWQDHYGYPCPITAEDWARWCRAPRSVSKPEDYDIVTEQREGWAYDTDRGN